MIREIKVNGRIRVFRVLCTSIVVVQLYSVLVIFFADKSRDFSIFHDNFLSIC